MIEPGKVMEIEGKVRYEECVHFPEMKCYPHSFGVINERFVPGVGLNDQPPNVNGWISLWGILSCTVGQRVKITVEVLD